MNRNKLKTYAPQARRDFIQAVTDRAAQFGLTATKTEPMTEQGEVVLIGGQPFPKAVGKKRQKLAERITKLGFGQTMEAMAYTWFNRLVAIRFMELHGYLEHGFRVLSHPEGHPQPEILEHAQDVDLPGLDKQKVVALKLDGTKEEELYRLLLTAQCNALHKAMPFLFESIDDETELLLPDHLLHSDSLIRHLVNEIPEEDWQEVEIIGWLYQFYVIDEKKRIDDYSKSKPVKPEDIPAKTQLFTPNWIVKYLVQNSVGRQWLATYPQSALRQQMQYYIEPAEQTPEVQEQLKAITPTSLNPEELGLLDPACGSGHILAEAYDLFKTIYQERGYRAKDIPSLILQKNLFGLEIDDRAAQLAAFALMMKARADDRRIFEGETKPNIVAIQDSKGLDAKEITEAINQPILKEGQPPSGELFEEIADARSPLFSKKSMGEKGVVSQADVKHLISLFEHGKTFGSLIQVPELLAERLPAINERVEAVIAHGGMFEKAVARQFRTLLQPAVLLACRQYDATVANPPYLGSRALAGELKAFVGDKYPNAKGDLYSAMLEKAFHHTLPHGRVAMVTMETWMFLGQFQDFRETLLDTYTLSILTHMPYEGRGRTSMGIAFGTDAKVFHKSHVPNYRASFSFVQHTDLNDDGVPNRFPVPNARLCAAVVDDFRCIPSSPIAYWISEGIRRAFHRSVPLHEIAEPRLGMATGDNSRYVRLWHEVSIAKCGFGIASRDEAVKSKKKWFPYNKGGDYRRWFGNNECVVDWENDGFRLQTTQHPTGRIWAHNFNLDYIFKPSVTWTFVSSAYFGVRKSDSGFLFDVGGSSAFPAPRDAEFVTGLLCSRPTTEFLKALNPSLNFQAGNIGTLPVVDRMDAALKNAVSAVVSRAVAIARMDWDSSEASWNFAISPLQRDDVLCDSLSKSFAKWQSYCKAAVQEMLTLERENNRLFINAYGLEGELSPEIHEEAVTLYRPDQEEDIKRLISYAVGCMMGRYSLDKPGLIYAQSGNQGFDASQYKTFTADEDGILPLTELHWFPDDAPSRFEKFIATAWPAEHRDENLKFVAESLGPKKGESPRETIRRYLAADFFKHHLSMYKKRPIYWLFSSGKQRGFQALVYLHRYNEGTLARMRTEYVVPLLGKMKARIDQLTDDIAAANSSQHKKKLETEKSTITKQLAEVQTFEEKLRHSADERIKLDLDDGVKVNYGKFGDLVAEVKSVTGGSADE